MTYNLCSYSDLDFQPVFVQQLKNVRWNHFMYLPYWWLFYF